MENQRIMLAVKEEADEIYALYHSLIDMPCSTWDEEYPSREMVQYDLENEEILIMRSETGKLIAAIAISTDDEELRDAAQWYSDVTRFITLSRLGVDQSMQGQGIAKKMLVAAMQRCRQRGYEAVRFLVSKTNPYPQRAYAKLNFDICGETELFDHQWLCYQKKL